MKSKNPVSATILNFTWNIPTHWLLAVEHSFGGRFAGSNYIGTEVPYVLAYAWKVSKTV